MTAAARLDRLSDWIGTLVPGCSRLPARHPVKVSLVLGAFALIAGWATLGSILGVSTATTLPEEALMTLIPGLFLGLLVSLPLMLWQERSFGMILLATLLAFAAGAFHMVLLDQFGRRGPQALEIGWGGLIAGLGYILAGIIPNRRRDFWMVFPVPLFSGLWHAAIVFCLELRQVQNALPPPFDSIIPYTLVANLFAWIFAGIAITFGTALWDRTPPPKFESAEMEND